MTTLLAVCVPVAVWLAVELAEARTDARRRHQRLIERRVPAASRPSNGRLVG